MPEIDYQRNYYEDLELGPDAEPKDIRSQHRALGTAERMPKDSWHC